MSDEFKVQWSISLPPAAQYAKGDMLNLRGDTVEDVEAIFDAVLANDSEFLVKAAEVGTILRSVSVVNEGLSVVQNDAPAASGEPAPVATLHVCQHGKRTRREGSGRKGPWVGWFCPRPKGSADQCDPEWED